MNFFEKHKQALIKVLIITAGVAALYFIVTKLFTRDRVLNNVLKAYELYSTKDATREIEVYYGDPLSEGRKIYKARIFASKEIVNQIKQAVLFLLAPAPRNFVSYMPEGTSLREVFLDANKICYLDFSKELSLNSKGGTTGEYRLVFSIVNTVVKNFPEIAGVKILIEGREVESLSGHIKIKGILKS